MPRGDSIAYTPTMLLYAKVAQPKAPKKRSRAGAYYLLELPVAASRAGMLFLECLGGMSLD